jgi:hypothetical protein
MDTSATPTRKQAEVAAKKLLGAACYTRETHRNYDFLVQSWADIICAECGIATVEAPEHD